MNLFHKVKMNSSRHSSSWCRLITCIYDQFKHTSYSNKSSNNNNKTLCKSCKTKYFCVLFDNNTSKIDYWKTSSTYHMFTSVRIKTFTHFLPMVSFYAPIKISENFWFSDVFREYRKRWKKVG